MRSTKISGYFWFSVLLKFSQLCLRSKFSFRKYFPKWGEIWKFHVIVKMSQISRKFLKSYFGYNLLIPKNTVRLGYAKSYVFEVVKTVDWIRLYKLELLTPRFNQFNHTNFKSSLNKLVFLATPWVVQMDQIGFPNGIKLSENKFDPLNLSHLGIGRSSDLPNFWSNSQVQILTHHFGSSFWRNVNSN